MIYPKTFLKDVSVYVSFPDVSLSLDFNDRLRAYISNEFSVSDYSNIEIDKINSPSGLKIATSDGYVIFNFFSHAILLKVKFPVYRCFDNIASLFPKLMAYISLFDPKFLSCVKITKYNELQFNCQNDSFPINEIMAQIFSKHLMDEVTQDVPNLSKHTRLERFMDIKDSDSNTKTNITFGYVIDDINPKKGALTLKTSVENIVFLHKYDFDSEITSYNRLVDRVFHWCVKDNILNQMRIKSDKR